MISGLAVTAGQSLVLFHMQKYCYCQSCADYDGATDSLDSVRLSVRLSVGLDVCPSHSSTFKYIPVFSMKFIFAGSMQCSNQPDILHKRYAKRLVVGKSISLNGSSRHDPSFHILHGLD